MWNLIAVAEHKRPHMKNLRNLNWECPADESNPNKYSACTSTSNIIEKEDTETTIHI